jgi:hypothetical protein
MEFVARVTPEPNECYPCEVYEKVVALQTIEEGVEYDVVYTVVLCLN